MHFKLQKAILFSATAAIVSSILGNAAIAEPAALDRPLTVANQPPLLVTPLRRLPIGQVRADGWLLRQLELQKTGLTGSAEQLYDALTPDSAWLGGKGESWEKGPYYIRGLIALAYTLDDAELKTRSQKWVDWAIKSQRPERLLRPGVERRLVATHGRPQLHARCLRSHRRFSRYSVSHKLLPFSAQKPSQTTTRRLGPSPGGRQH
ncbi:MAG: hypothetical protein QM754_08700 [Tepidisphaeraceae bacterium]